MSDVVGGSVRLRQLLSLRELVQTPLDVEQLRAGLVSLHGDHGGVAATLENDNHGPSVSVVLGIPGIRLRNEQFYYLFILVNYRKGDIVIEETPLDYRHNNGDLWNIFLIFSNIKIVSVHFLAIDTAIELNYREG